MNRRATCVIGAFLVLWLGGCEAQPPASERKPHSRPAAEKPTPALSPTEGEAAPRPATTQPATAPAEPELPEYLTLVARFDAQQPVRVQVISAEGRRLVLDTHNVSRLRIDRAQVPVQRDRSIVLLLDGQGIEWLASSKVVEFERSENGVWRPVRPE